MPRALPRGRCCRRVAQPDTRANSVPDPRFDRCGDDFGGAGRDGCAVVGFSLAHPSLTPKAKSSAKAACNFGLWWSGHHRAPPGGARFGR